MFSVWSSELWKISFFLMHKVDQSLLNIHTFIAIELKLLKQKKHFSVVDKRKITIYHNLKEIGFHEIM